MILRQFLYLDSELTRQFLAQVEGGVYSRQDQRLVERRGKELAGELGASVMGARLGAKGGKTTGSEEEIERSVELTPEAEFARLYELLDASGGVRFLERIDDEIWSDVSRGELVEVDVRVSVSALARYSNLVEQIGPLMQLMQSVGETIDDETQQAMQGIGMLGQIFGSSIPIVAEAIGGAGHKFAASLDPAGLRAAVDQIDGEATLLGKVHRKLPEGESYTVFDLIPGFRAMPKAQRRDLEKDLTNSTEFPDMVVAGPLAVVTAVALYR